MLSKNHFATTGEVVGLNAGSALVTYTLKLSDDVILEKTVTVIVEHTHSFASDWTYDTAGHWHACSGCEEKLDFAARHGSRASMFRQFRRETA